ncbi:hypothetical protein CK203_090059 [Vitis vinifera]|uniref:Uncharacterized protein n=1 Tax=Vitis vinifera TaxID=29760 RepID=A0A438DY26_VITVI|nr:hypothetical protein CK203_090059 [Vitis vinifera]
MGSGYVRIIGKWQQPWKIKTSTPSSFASVHQLRNIRNSEISRPINLLSSRSFSSSSSRSSKIGFLGWYLGMLETSPLITKSVTSSLIFAAADLTSQKIMCHLRALLTLLGHYVMTGYGLLILGPSQHLWFNFVAKSPTKARCDHYPEENNHGQAIFGPCINSVFFSVNAALARYTRNLYF